MLVLRFVAAAAETGDAACYDAAFAEAEAAFGPREGALVVARAAALLRAAAREGVALASLPPPCRSLSTDEAPGLLAATAGARRTGRLRPARAAATCRGDRPALSRDLAGPARHGRPV